MLTATPPESSASRASWWRWKLPGPAALIAFLDADSYEETVRNAVSLGGDSDTLACIASGIAEAFYGGVPEAIRAELRARLTPDLWAVVEAFEHRYPVEAVRC